MTPVSFAKLILRMLAGGMLFLYLPLAFSLWISIITRDAGGAVLTDPFVLSRAIFNLFSLAISLLIWIRADRLALLLLPSGTSPVASADYVQWQRGGMIFIGGCLALRACVYLEGFIAGLMGNPDFSYGLLPVVCNLIVAFILIIGWDNLARVFSRNQYKA